MLSDESRTVGIVPIWCVKGQCNSPACLHAGSVYCTWFLVDIRSELFIYFLQERLDLVVVRAAMLEHTIYRDDQVFQHRGCNLRPILMAPESHSMQLLLQFQWCSKADQLWPFMLEIPMTSICWRPATEMMTCLSIKVWWRVLFTHYWKTNRTWSFSWI